MQMTTAESWLIGFLKCGVLDIEMLDDCTYTVEEVLDRCENEYGTHDINLVMTTIMEMGMDDLSDAIKERIVELELDNTAESGEELLALKSLDPHNDIVGWFNCLDTHITLEVKVEIYQKYLSDAIESFENNTGFTLSMYQ